MSDEKIIVASIVNFLKQQLDNDVLNADSRESVEVGIQCIETAFEITPEELSKGVDLMRAIRRLNFDPQVAKAEAEKMKNEGNELMKAERYREALEKYNRAILINPNNPVYFCNRAATHFKLGNNQNAVNDCRAALSIQPHYGKAHGRLGIALTALDRHVEARAAFARAAQLEPDNESYKQNLQLAEQRVAQQGGGNRLDLGGLLQNPALMNMATEMLTDPNMQNLISGLMTTTQPAPVDGAGGMNALLEAGQALAQHMQAANPDLVERLRSQMRPPGAPGAPGSNQPPPAPQ